MHDLNREGLGGWLAVYLIGSIPLLWFYAMGLSGWFFEYPIGLMVAIFAVFAVPLGLLLARHRLAVRWNVGLVWAAAVLIILRSLAVIFEPGAWDAVTGDRLVVTSLASIVTVSIGWAIAWTLYFRRSRRVSATFPSVDVRRMSL
jgi:hypothetical protein